MLNRRHDQGELVDAVDSSTISDSRSGVPSVEIVRPISVYLAHNYGQRDAGLKIQSLLEAAGIKVFNPFERPDQAELDAAYPNLTLEQCQQIVTGDLNRINQADTVVAVLQGDHMAGTFMEIYHNAVLNSRVTFSLVLDEVYKAHPWIRTLTRQHYNVESLITELLRWPNL